MDLTPRLTHRIEVARTAVGSALQQQFMIALEEFDRVAVLSGAAAAVFAAIENTFREKGMSPAEAASRTNRFWCGLGDQFASLRGMQPPPAAKDAQKLRK